MVHKSLVLGLIVLVNQSCICTDLESHEQASGTTEACLVENARQPVIASSEPATPPLTPSTPSSFIFALRGLFDLEKLLDENPAILDDFENLSDEEREKLVESVDLFNEAFQDALSEAVQDVAS